MSEADPRPPVDFDGAAAHLGTTPRHVRGLKANGELPFVKVGGLVRFLPFDLDAYIAANRQEAS